MSSKLENSSLVTCDFASSIDKSQKGDLIYCDPVYSVNEKSNGFIKYNDRVFNWNDQLRLKDCIDKAVKRGVNVVLSNIHHECVLDLYKDYPYKIIERKSLIGKKRKTISECLFVIGKNEGLRMDIFDSV